MDYKPLSGREFPRYSGIKTFFRLPYVPLKSNYEVALFGIPYDGGVSYRPGARFAPSKLREVSSLGRGFHLAKEINFFDKIKVADIGDCPTVPIDQNQTYEKIENFIDQLTGLDKKFIAVGGDHSITLPILRSLNKHYKIPLRLIHFDAHLDTYPAAWNCEYHHGAFLRHAINEKLINSSLSFQVGIRGPLAGGEDLDFVNKAKMKSFIIDEVRESSLTDFIKILKNKLNSASTTIPTYITFDIDSLDPAYAPGTGTPVPGGLTSFEVQKILRSLSGSNIVGADIVEILPASDHSDITSLMGMDVMFEMLTLMAEFKK
jgi:agmatinase/guanidinopropionase